MQLRHGEANPLEVILSMGCYIDLACSRYDHQYPGRPVNDVLLEFLNSDSQSIFLLMGTSGSGKSLLLWRHFVKMNRNGSGRGNSELRYNFKCMHLKLNLYAEAERKGELGQKVKFEMQSLLDSEKLILYLDGFDEFGEGREQLLNILGIRNDSHLRQRVKVIVTARTQGITPDEMNALFIKELPHTTEV